MSDLQMTDVRAVFKKVRELQAERDDYRAAAKDCNERIKALLGGLSERALEDDSQVKLFGGPTAMPLAPGRRPLPRTGEGPDSALPTSDR